MKRLIPILICTTMLAAQYVWADASNITNTASETSINDEAIYNGLIYDEIDNTWYTDDEKYSEFVDIMKEDLAKSAEIMGTYILATDDDIIFVGGINSEDVNGNKVDAYTTYEIGSLTKMMTATAVLQLCDHGSLSLNDRLEKFFPGYPKIKDITIYQLLHMQSGLRMNFEQDQLFTDDEGNPDIEEYLRYYSDGYADEELLEMLLHSDLIFEPGTKFEYSNAGYTLLAMIIEKITGQSFEAYVSENVFDICGMDHSSAMTTGDITSIPLAGDNNPFDPVKGEFMLHFLQARTSRGAADIHSCAADLLMYDRALMNGKLLSTEALDEMFRMDMTYGCGWEAYPEYENIWYHGGRTFSYRSFNMHLKTEEYGNLYLIQLHPTMAGEDYSNALMDDIAYAANNPETLGWKRAIKDLPEDFIFGMDASSVLSEEKSGVKYYDFEGNEQDVLKTFADAGINYIRLRVWNDPFDKDGNGYGGGNCDLETAIELGKRATKYGMKVMIDFHYSDFWADPKRQHPPKEWEGMNLEEKAEALYAFTKDSLQQLLDAGVDVGMIQIGNEINYGMSGETSQEKVIELLKAGSKAIREVSEERSKKIQIAVHYTRITDKADVLNLVKKLVSSKLDFDMIGLSYYPFWDGSMSTMSRMLELIQKRCGKKAFIAETSYCYTTKDGDGFGNSLTQKDLVDGYDASVDGQASMIRDICESVSSGGGKGIFYWEGAWIPVGSSYAENKAIWEKYGSGWASSYASDYDPDDAGLYYGGSSWDNQAFFDFEGKPLESLKVFEYMKK